MARQHIGWGFYVNADDLKLRGEEITAAGGEVDAAAHDAIGWAAEQFVPLMQAELAKVRVTGAAEGSVCVLAHGETAALVGPDTSANPYVAHIIKGGTPHFAPFHKIHHWVVTKLGEGPPTDMITANKIWWSIAHYGTSQWAREQGWGSSGENPIALRVATSQESKAITEQAADMAGSSVVARATR